MVVNVSTLEKLIYPIMCAGSAVQPIKEIFKNTKAPSSMVNHMALVCYSACKMGPYEIHFIVEIDHKREYETGEYEHKNGKYFGKATQYYSK